ncbi:uncharacterized protein LOC142544655 isoform X3 [Primulina tabacum]|uniref:uncharacterized protein LOC142544655 isoform X3 n=1 Tax=Primulina tabacum TaxID=48773 RepID=UPI003F592FBC
MNSANEKWFDETTSNSFLFASATQDELSVSQILLGLENLTPFPRFIWGCRKRRSCLDAAPSAPASVPIAEEEIEVRRSLAEEAAAAAATSSPATPLSFSPSEPDGKSKRSSKKILKKRISLPMILQSRAEFINKIEELTKHGEWREGGGKCERNK